MAKQVIIYSSNDHLARGNNTLLECSPEKNIIGFKLIPAGSKLYDAWFQRLRDSIEDGRVTIHITKSDCRTVLIHHQLNAFGTVIDDKDIKSDCVKVVLGRNSILLVNYLE